MATRKSGPDPMRSLQQSVEKLSNAFDKMADRLEATSNGHVAPAASGAPVAQTVWGRHLQQWGAFYALGLILLLIIVFAPTRDHNNDQAQQANSITNTDTGATGDVGTGTTSTGTNAASSTTSNTGSAVHAAAPQVGLTDLRSAAGKKVEAEIVPWAWKASGKTIGGFDCHSGIRQIP